MTKPIVCTDHKLLHTEIQRLRSELSKAQETIEKQKHEIALWKRLVEATSGEAPGSPKSVVDGSSSMPTSQGASSSLCFTGSHKASPESLTSPRRMAKDPPSTSSSSMADRMDDSLELRGSNCDIPDRNVNLQNEKEANVAESNDSEPQTDSLKAEFRRKKDPARRLKQLVRMATPLPTTPEHGSIEGIDDQSTSSVSHCDEDMTNTKLDSNCREPEAPTGRIAPSNDDCELNTASAKNLPKKSDTICETSNQSMDQRVKSTGTPPNDAPGIMPPKRTASPQNWFPIQPAVRGLPREKSIVDHSDSDISPQTSPDRNELARTIEVENCQMRDASNERGLYSGSMDCKTHLPDGYGTLKYHKQGKEYTGDWEQGRYHGHGILKNGQGDVYEGPFIQGLKEGQDATMTFRDGRTFHGRYHLDKMREGLLKFADGSFYDGLLENNKRNGFGLYTFPSGDQYEGQWRNDLMHGRGRMEWKSDGTWYNGDWEYGIQHGMGTEVDSDGTIKHQGRFQHGKPVPVSK